IREGYQEIDSWLPSLGDAKVLRARARDVSITPADRDQVLRSLVYAYRMGPKPLWGPLLLELLAPAIMARIVTFKIVEPAITSEDIRHQLLIEVLEAAATMPMPEDARYVERRILLRAAQRVSRWLAREQRRQARQTHSHGSM